MSGSLEAGAVGASGLACPEGQQSVAASPPARGPELSPRPAWPISASRAWGWETLRAGLAPLSFWWRRRRLGNWLRPGRAGFLAVRRAPDVASLASASAKLPRLIEIRLGLPGLLLSASGDELDLLAPAFGHPRLFLRRLPLRFGSCHAESSRFNESGQFLRIGFGFGCLHNQKRGITYAFAGLPQYLPRSLISFQVCSGMRSPAFSPWRTSQPPPSER